MLDNLKITVRNILLSIFPPFCCHCQKYGSLLCTDCYEEIHFLPQICITKNQHRYLDNIIATVEFNQVIHSLIYTLKYSAILDVGIVLGKMIYQTVSLPYYDFITCVPLHKLKENKRGFNQADIIGRTIAICHSSLFYSFLRRTHFHKNLASIKNKSERKQKTINIYAFENKYKKIIKNKIVLIIDDVYTTGGTLEECARVLKLHGAKAVVGLVVCRKA